MIQLFISILLETSPGLLAVDKKVLACKKRDHNIDTHHHHQDQIAIELLALNDT